jgi:uncharacterized protein with ParB-like and HNH nuclease domain
MEINQTEKTLFTVGNFVSWKKSNTLILSPAFQRKSVWNKGAKSLLIDSVVRGLPIPIIFLRETLTDIEELETKLEVVDGQQRLRTLFSFIDPKLLKDFDERRDSFLVRREHNAQIAQKKFSELSEEIRRKILNYRFSVHIFSSSVDDKQILEIFSRLNSTGVRLNAQELRNSRYFGLFRISNYQLAGEQLPRWRSWKLFNEDNIARMNEVELTSELTILIMRGEINSKTHWIDKYYALYEEKFSERFEVEKRFRLVMDTIEEFFGENIKYWNIKKTLFYALFASIYFLYYGIGNKLNIKDKQKNIPNDRIKQLEKSIINIAERKVPERIVSSLTKRTTDRSSRKALVEYLLG